MHDSHMPLQAPEWYKEDLVGQAIYNTRIPRSTLFLTTKLHPRHHGFNSTLRQMQRSFDNLQTDWLDLVLLHYPRQVILIGEAVHQPGPLVLQPSLPLNHSPQPPPPPFPFPGAHTPLHWRNPEDQHADHALRHSPSVSNCACSQ